MYIVYEFETVCSCLCSPEVHRVRTDKKNEAVLMLILSSVKVNFDALRYELEGVSVRWCCQSWNYEGGRVAVDTHCLAVLRRRLICGNMVSIGETKFLQ